MDGSKNQFAGFYMRVTLVVNGFILCCWKASKYFLKKNLLQKYFSYIFFRDNTWGKNDDVCIGENTKKFAYMQNMSTHLSFL